MPALHRAFPFEEMDEIPMPVAEDLEEAVARRRRGRTLQRAPPVAREGEPDLGVAERELRFDRVLVDLEFLGDLPVLGRLFRKTTSDSTKSELLIFITPRVVNDVLASQ